MSKNTRRTHAIVAILSTRNNVHSWRDVIDVLMLRLPPYRWRRCVPLPRFGFGPTRIYGALVVRCGWWGVRV